MSTANFINGRMSQIITGVMTLFVLSLFPLAGQAQIPGGVLQTTQTNAGLTVVLKKSTGEIMRYAVDSEGAFNFGMLAEGAYNITFSFATAANAKTFYESHSNTTRAVTVQKAPGKARGIPPAESVTAIWDARQNQLFELNNMSPRILQGISFEVKGAMQVSGVVAGFSSKDFPNITAN
ncbi:MAG: hypothetical protein ACKV2V_04300 [Blastocatellia bacterium]